MANETVYFKLDCNFNTASTVRAKITKIDTIINELLTVALVRVKSGNVADYEIDTGQTRNYVTYTKMDEVISAIKDYEDLKVYYQNKLIPRNIVLRDKSNFRRQ